jgi:uncharacterized protein (TIGR03067 family)
MKLKYLTLFAGLVTLTSALAQNPNQPSAPKAPIDSAGPDKKMPPKPLTIDGVWIPTKAELAGNKVPEENLKITRLFLEGEKYIVTVNDAVADQGLVKLIADSNPKAMRIIGTEGPNKGRTIPAIYELKGDELNICYNLNGEDFPKEFKSEQGSRFYLATYKRKKD